jgi:predicted transcriptional regulator
MLGALESDVLRTLKTVPKGGAREVRAELEERGTVVAYTTVATILARLHEKGLVRRRRERCRGGTRYVYRPLDFEQKYLQNLLKGVVKLFGPSGVVHLEEELDRIRPAEARRGRRPTRLKS